MKNALAILALCIAGAGVAADVPAPRWDAPGAGNPLLPGYFADPSIVRDKGRWYIFATIDPWGDDRLGLWQSDNGRDWTFSTPDWPTKRAATSPTSGDAKVWAPSVVQAKDGRWWMYVSVGNEIWVGTAPSAAGPWRDANGGKPLVNKAFAPKYHMIDAEAFIDDDGQAYLYWGSGWNWTNGHCFVAKLKPDMIGFDGPVRDVTPTNYFEGPFMVKANGRYVLTYSDGNTTKDTYKVRYAVGATPFGPFTEGATSPILQTDAARQVISPGHHAVFRSGGKPYILYHRQGLPFDSAGTDVKRQVAVDALLFAANGTIAKVIPTHAGAAVSGFAAQRRRGLRWQASGSAGDSLHGPDRAADDNYATVWKPTGTGAATLIADLGAIRQVRETRLRPEFATKPYRFRIEQSHDGRTWLALAPDAVRSGSPIVVAHPATTRWLRMVFTDSKDIGVWEWSID
ncbi:family 43 glycosylhydrolase [Microvirga sp. SRT01]|uniref:Family 43 glycosylhydrolase n=1 Tax=Sphingomonas longa TaxID=2778730 RepID=A0ABS2D9D4_9SPHN|nr:MULTISPECIES: family 43 glycosylhydrolase [Alphaproteobacteria]MBM6577545.1 family 43 glycosylhydrolase [Sphingomonas sp. BT552]MBR7710590.1 family 43 glycosylhydrolase [Microvirga sp. SRT01]